MPAGLLHAVTLPPDLSSPQDFTVVGPDRDGLTVAIGLWGRRVQVALDGARLDALSEILGASWERFVAPCVAPQDGAPSPARRAHLDARTAAFLSALAVLIRERAPEPAAPGAALVARALHYLAVRCHDPTLTVEDVARAVGRSPTYLASVFRAETGAGVRQILIRTRLERARRLLEAGRYAVKEVARLTGWSTQHHFSTSYRAQFGYPPSRSARRAPGGREPEG